MTGGWGADCLKGGYGNDAMWGDDGDDDMEFMDSADTLIGGHGNDEIHGEGGNDQIAGTAGNDVFYGGSGNDLIVPGSGNDTSVWRSAGADTLEFHQDDIDFYAFRNAYDVIRDWDATNGHGGDVIRWCGQPAEFDPVKIQFGAFLGDGNQPLTTPRILCNNGQKIHLDDGAVANWSGPFGIETEFDMGIASFTDPLTPGKNADDFELVYLSGHVPADRVRRSGRGRGRSGAANLGYHPILAV